MGALEKKIFTNQINVSEGLTLQNDGGELLFSRKFKCCRCGKIGYKTGDWSYKRVGAKISYFCSYTCMRAFDIERARKKELQKAEKEAAKRDKENAAANKAV